MKRAGLDLLFALALFCGLAAPASDAGEDPACDGVAEKIVKFAGANGVDKIAVLGFAAKGGAGKDETDYVSESLGVCLAGRARPALIERALLEKVLKEARLSSEAGGDGDKAKALRDIFSLDAVVTGTVFAAGDRLKIVTKLIDVKTGRVLLAARSESPRERQRDPELPDLIDLEWDSAQWALPPAGLRDAVADPQAGCAERKKKLSGLNSELVEQKARYWADRMREPGFSVRGLTRNPGSEIADPEVRARFYKLLGGYYQAGGSAPQAPEALAAVQGLLDEEKRAYDECGFR